MAIYRTVRRQLANLEASLPFLPIMTMNRGLSKRTNTPEVLVRNCNFHDNFLLGFHSHPKEFASSVTRQMSNHPLI